MKICIVIPFYNHAGAIAHVVDSLKPLGLQCFIVDDGSDPSAQRVLSQIAGVDLNPFAAAIARFRLLIAALQASRITRLSDAPVSRTDASSSANRLAVSKSSGRDGQWRGHLRPSCRVPRYGRYITHVWVWINTLSLDIRDSMCGLLVYPLAATCEIWRRHASAGAWISTPRSWCDCTGAEASSRFRRE
jgi:glycosyltransferase involved in cell wall biosynthesis